MKRILLIGATSAVASEVARIYAREGATLFLVARNRSKLKLLADQLGAAVVGTSSYDFLDTAHTAQELQKAIAALGSVDLALVAHGDLGDQLKSERDFAEAKRILATNFECTMAQLIFLANYFETEGAGHLAVISSVAAERGRPRNYTYGAAKMALTIYLQGLRSRLYPSVFVTTIKMGPVDTPMTEKHEKNASFATVSQAANGIVRALSRKKKEVFVPCYWGPIIWVVKRLPEPIFHRIRFLSGR